MATGMPVSGHGTAQADAKWPNGPSSKSQFMAHWRVRMEASRMWRADLTSAVCVYKVWGWMTESCMISQIELIRNISTGPSNTLNDTQPTRSTSPLKEGQKDAKEGRMH